MSDIQSFVCQLILLTFHIVDVLHVKISYFIVLVFKEKYLITLF